MFLQYDDPFPAVVICRISFVSRQTTNLYRARIATYEWYCSKAPSGTDAALYPASNLSPLTRFLIICGNTYGHRPENWIHRNKVRRANFFPQGAQSYFRGNAVMIFLPFTILLGAFLLFQVQPLMARFILPWFGGSTAVWTTCMLFFQFFLLAGYAYAHLSIRWLRPRAQAGLHVLLLLTALGFVPVIPGMHWRPVGDEEPTGRILLMLTACLGMPYLVLAATAPLLQAWDSRLRGGTSPYRLYALSNAGSLLALISYPFGFEPAFTRVTQATLWGAGFAAFVLLCGACAVQIWRRTPAEPAGENPVSHSPGNATPVVFVVGWTRFLWFALSACGSVLLLATTNALCQDVAAIPFLWVLPLCLYLLTFMICFDRPAWYRRKSFLALAVPVLALLCWAAQRQSGLSLSTQVVIYCGSLFVCCLICHGELYRLKPAPQSLTSFYLCSAAGGAAGGAFVAVIAPLVFRSFAELGWGLWLFGALLLALHWREQTNLQIGNRRWPLWRVIAPGVVGLGVVLLLQARAVTRDAVSMSRNFYGVLRVSELEKNDPEYHAYLLTHGNISQGLQFLHPDKARLPIGYFNEQSGVGLAMHHLARQSKRHVGVVGLGVGTLAAYGKPGDRFRFYEINPEVIRLAQTRFTYLDSSPARVDVVRGDGRLSLEREATQQFDLLVLDAFNGDAPPIHLLTREAFAIYLRHLAPEGVIALNISNRHVDLFRVVLGHLDHFQLGMVYIPWWEKELPWGLYASQWVLLTRSREFLRTPAIVSSARRPLWPDATNAVVWTDDFASLFPVLVRSGNSDRKP